jgi:hypothetical protein
MTKYDQVGHAYLIGLATYPDRSPEILPVIGTARDREQPTDRRIQT